MKCQDVLNRVRELKQRNEKKLFFFFEFQTEYRQKYFVMLTIRLEIVIDFYFVFYLMKQEITSNAANSKFKFGCVEIILQQPTPSYK